MKKSLLLVAISITASVGCLFGQQAQQLELSGAGFSVDSLVAMSGYFLPPVRNQLPTAGNRQPQAQAGDRSGISVSSNPEYYFTTAQVDALLPVFQELAANPYPSPSKAKQIQKQVEDVLTREQQREWDKYVKEVQTRMRDTPTGAGGQIADLQNMSDEERESFLADLPEEQRKRIQERFSSDTNRRSLSAEERRLRSIESLMDRLAEHRKNVT